MVKYQVSCNDPNDPKGLKTTTRTFKHLPNAQAFRADMCVFWRMNPREIPIITRRDLK